MFTHMHFFSICFNFVLIFIVGMLVQSNVLDI
jgi:hypothetical protein